MPSSLSFLLACLFVHLARSAPPAPCRDSYHAGSPRPQLAALLRARGGFSLDEWQHPLREEHAKAIQVRRQLAKEHRLVRWAVGTEEELERLRKLVNRFITLTVLIWLPVALISTAIVGHQSSHGVITARHLSTTTALIGCCCVLLPALALSAKSLPLLCMHVACHPRDFDVLLEPLIANMVIFVYMFGLIRSAGFKRNFISVKQASVDLFHEMPMVTGLSSTVVASYWAALALRKTFAVHSSFAFDPQEFAKVAWKQCKDFPRWLRNDPIPRLLTCFIAIDLLVTTYHRLFFA
jgi:hypothetical protein